MRERLLDPCINQRLDVIRQRHREVDLLLLVARSWADHTSGFGRKNARLHDP